MCKFLLCSNTSFSAACLCAGDAAGVFWRMVEVVADLQNGRSTSVKHTRCIIGANARLQIIKTRDSDIGEFYLIHRQPAASQVGECQS